MSVMFWCLLHFMAVSFMCGVIWIVQFVHYPMFKKISAAEWAEAHRFHSVRITYIVAPLMLLELATAVILLYLGEARFVWSLNLLSVLLLFAATAFISVPLHDRLQKNGYDLSVIERLVSTNLIRTLIWTLRVLGLGLYFVLFGFS